MKRLVSLLGSLAGRIREFVNSHLIPAVTGWLALSWIVTSWMVYRAERMVTDSNIKNFGDGLWWGMVTLLTVGYGDRYPVTTHGRIWAGILMLSGVFAVAMITSKISSYFMERVLREGRGIVNASKLKNHFIICGWKEEIEDLFCHILDLNPDMHPSDLVLVANLSPLLVESLKEHPRLKGIQFVLGDFFHSSNLMRAAPERARKILILADQTPHASGAAPTVTETDAKTIMTAMTLANLARGTLVAAEILDPKMDQYLRLASVNEIIYSREYSRLLLGNVSGGTGVSNIMFELLDPKAPAFITTRTITEDWVGKDYQKFKSGFEASSSGSLVLGVLENTGNSHRIKELALRQAQKTPDMHRLVENLKAVKELKCNYPVFNPREDYVIREGSMAIVLEVRNPQTNRGDHAGETTATIQAA